VDGICMGRQHAFPIRPTNADLLIVIHIVLRLGTSVQRRTPVRGQVDLSGLIRVGRRRLASVGHPILEVHKVAA